MIGLIVFIVLGIYIFVCWTITKWIAKFIQNQKTKMIVAFLLLPILLMLPFADELIGEFQYDQLCRDAEDVKIYGTIPVGEELYFPDGRWKMGSYGSNLSRVEKNQIDNVYESLVDHQHSKTKLIHKAIPIRSWQVNIISKSDGRLLASMQWYATGGGWIGRYLFGGMPFFVNAQCHSSQAGEKLSQKILPFNKSNIK